AELALAVAAVFFAVRYTSLAAWLERRLRPEILTVAVVAFLGLYAFVGLGWPAEFAGIARWILASGGAAAGYQPSSYGYGVPAGGDVTGGAGWIPFAIVAAVLVLYGYCAFAQGRDFIRTGLPLQGALAVAYVLLAQAQVSQFLGPIWTPSWWEYHGLMLAAGVIAMFGAMSDPTNGALAAARAALAMRASIAQLNTARAGRGEIVVQFGMGLHTGDVVVGAVGLPERSQYDAIGDAVNTASRMETLTKEFHVDSILSGDTAERLRNDGVALRPLGEAHVKGKANAIEVFTLG